MSKKTIATGMLHKVSNDLRESLASNPNVLAKWNSPTPIARNEWICWITFFKKSETRKNHIKRLLADLLEGKRRPCCWPGCPHRKSNVKHN